MATEVMNGSTPTWSDADTDALRELVQDEDQRQWQIGDLLLQRLPWGEPGKSSGVSAKFREIAAAVGAEPSSLKRYRQTARAWPKESRISFASWSAHAAMEGHPNEADERAQVLASLPRNEHGYVTRKAVRDLTKGSRGKPGWFELLGMVGDSLLKAQSQMERAEKEIADGFERRGEEPNEDLRAKAGEYAGWADALAARLREIEAWAAS